MKMNKETALAATLFFLGISALSVAFISIWQLFLPLNQTIAGFVALLYLASIALTGIFSLLAFWYHTRKAKK